MTSLTKRKRARLALQMLGKQPPPTAGTYGLIWVRFVGENRGHAVATVTALVRSRAYAQQSILVDLDDIALVTQERP